MQAIAEGEEVTLMGWGNCIMRRVHKDGSGVVTGIDGGENIPKKNTKMRLLMGCCGV